MRIVSTTWVRLEFTGSTQLEYKRDGLMKREVQWNAGILVKGPRSWPFLLLFSLKSTCVSFRTSLVPTYPLTCGTSVPVSWCSACPRCTCTRAPCSPGTTGRCFPTSPAWSTRSGWSRRRRPRTWRCASPWRDTWPCAGRSRPEPCAPTAGPGLASSPWAQQPSPTTFPGETDLPRTSGEKLSPRGGGGKFSLCSKTIVGQMMVRTTQLLCIPQWMCGHSWFGQALSHSVVVM